MTEKKTKKRTPAKKSARAAETSTVGNEAPTAELPPPPAVTGPTQPPVAGIGASAGGLEAFKIFFKAMPADSGIAFVLIPHLDPTHESLMPELIARQTPMQVVEATEGMRVEANHVYIIPPNKYMTIVGGVLRLTGPVERRGLQTSIDLFLRSLADDLQEKAICIILSGTGSHGSLGLKAVKEGGGLTIVQDPETAAYPLMPRNAVATGLADFVLPVEQMPEALIRYIQHYHVNGGKSVLEEKEAPDQLNQVLALLRTRVKFDFRCYRKKMLSRRIERRMTLSHFNQLADYLDHLSGHPDEVKQLARDLLISVTSFFRDPEAFQTLATEVIAPLVRRKENDTPIRVWSVGCATGEEPYSLGILLQEALAAAQKQCPVQIFATDVDEDALQVARQAVYPESIVADVAAERLSRFFTRVDDTSYQVGKSLREMVVFARQNVINDAPFSKLDLVVCRNLLIYLEPETQKKLLPLLHFALNEGGVLFLGPSETIGRHTDLFEPIAKNWRIFRRIGPVRSDRVEFPANRVPEATSMAQRSGLPSKSVSYSERTHRVLLDQFCPAAVLINSKYEVLFSHGLTDRYIVFPAGEPSTHLMKLAREGLQSKLRSAVHKVQCENAPVTLSGIQIKRNGGRYSVSFTVTPLGDGAATERLFLVTFQDEATSHSTVMEPSDDSAAQQLELELKATRVDLQNTIEELERSNEELKASNEEVMSMNEELQSANEELETSKEELQSLNEELTTVNSQLHEKVAELETTNNDITNLLNCTDLATVFLDTEFRVRRFTPASSQFFSLINPDIGRHIGDISKKFTDPDLLDDAAAVLRQLVPTEREVPTQSGRWSLRRIIPYRTLDNRIDGVVLMFSDVTTYKHSEKALRNTESELKRLIGMMGHAHLFAHDLAGQLLYWPVGSERVYGFTREEAIGHKIDELLRPEYSVPSTEIYRLVQRDGHWQGEITYRRQDGSIVPVISLWSLVRDDGGRPVAIVQDMNDLTQYKRAEKALRVSETKLRLAVDAAQAVTWGWNVPENRFDDWTPAYRQLHGFTPDEPATYDVWLARIHPEDRQRITSRIKVILETPQDDEWREQYRIIHPQGGVRWLSGLGQATRDESGKVLRMVGVNLDITQQKEVETLLKNFNTKLEQEVAQQTDTIHARESQLRAILDNAFSAIITIDGSGIIRQTNPATERLFGYTTAEMLGQNVKMLMPSPYREIHDDYLRRYAETQQAHIIGTTREVQAQRKDGSLFDVSISVSQVDHLDLFTGILFDVSYRKQLELEVVETASQEQRRIGQDLHDSVAQELTALNILAADLSPAVQSNPTAARRLELLTEGLRRSQVELRDVLRGLLPVSIDREGLMSALSDLAARTGSSGDIRCEFDCPYPVVLLDNMVATHLFLIAQEAVRNAVKHSRCGRVVISLTTNGSIDLQVSDDGIGQPTDEADNRGLGLRIMRNRAAIIGAILTIGPNEPTGTTVRCVLPRRNHDAKIEGTAAPGPDRR